MNLRVIDVTLTHTSEGGPQQATLEKRLLSGIDQYLIILARSAGSTLGRVAPAHTSGA